MGLEEHIARGRAQGRSDEEILGAIQGFAPQYKEHIERGIANGRSASQIVDATSAYDTKFGKTQEPESKPLLNRAIDAGLAVTDPFRQSLANDLKGYAATGRVLNGQRNDDSQGFVTSALGGAADLIAPDPARYKPADVGFDNLGDVPKAVAEGSTGMATDIPAMLTGARLGAAGGAALGSVVPVLGNVAGGVVGGGLGALAGLGTSIFARTYGDRANRAAVSRTGDDTVLPNDADKAKALLAVSSDVALSRIGLKAGLGTAASASAGSVLKQVGVQAGKAAGVNAATGVAGEAIDQTLLDKEYNARRLEGAGITGAATGGVLRAASGVSDVNAARKFGDITPERAAPHLARLQATHGDNIPDTPQKSFEAMSKARRDLAGEIKRDNADPAFKELLARNEDARPAYDRVKDDIAAKKAPTEADMETLRQSIGQHDEGARVLKGFEEQVVSDKIIGMKGAVYDEKAGTFAGGAAASPFAQHYLNPLGGHGASYLAAGTGLYAALGHTIPGLHALHAFANPATALALPLGMAGSYQAMKAGGKLTGNADPMKLFRDRYSGSTAAPNGNLPKFADTLDQEKATAALEKQRNDALQKQVVDEAKAQASAEKALEKQRMDALEKQVLDADNQRRAQIKSEVQAAAALERQRSKALEKQVVDADKAKQAEATAQDSAVASLEKQRMKAFGREAMTGKPEAGPTSDASVNIRVAKLVQALQDKEAEATTPKPEPAAPKPHVKVPRGRTVPGTTPKGETVPRPDMYVVAHQDAPGGRIGIPVSKITHNKEAWANATWDKLQSRRDVMETALDNLPLSAEGRKFLRENMDDILKDAAGTTSRKEAEAKLDARLESLSPTDQAHVMQHLETKESVHGHKFYNTWK